MPGPCFVRNHLSRRHSPVTKRSAMLPSMLGPALAVLLVLSASGEKAAAPAPGDRLDGYVLPVEPVESGISLAALRGWAWNSGATRRLFLEGTVRVQVGGYDLSADAAV